MTNTTSVTGCASCERGRRQPDPSRPHERVDPMGRWS